MTSGVTDVYRCFLARGDLRIGKDVAMKGRAAAAIAVDGIYF